MEDLTDYVQTRSELVSSVYLNLELKRHEFFDECHVSHISALNVVTMLGLTGDQSDPVLITLKALFKQNCRK